MDDIYELVTRLCEKHVARKKRSEEWEYVNVGSIVKRIRSKAYELILNKRIPELKQKPLLSCNDDPVCHLLAWLMVLKCDSKQTYRYECAKRLIQDVEQSTLVDNPAFKNITCLLMALRDTGSDNVTFKPEDEFYQVHPEDTGPVPYRIYTENEFKLPTALNISEDVRFAVINPHIFTSEPSIITKISGEKISLSDRRNSIEYSTNWDFSALSNRLEIKEVEEMEWTEPCEIKDEGYDSPSFCNGKQEEIDIWQLMSDTTVAQSYTWESFGCTERAVEPHFACESGLGVAKKLETLMHPPDAVEEDIPMTELLRDVKFMLVGIASNLFSLNPKTNDFELRSGARVHGMMHRSLRNILGDLMLCGSCYKQLTDFCNAADESRGYIYKEFSKSIRRYLSFYRVVALSLSDKSSLLKADDHMREVGRQVRILTKICGRSGRGAACASSQLLTALYQEILQVTDKKSEIMLYSVFYPCCQVYFARFLQRWLFEGVLMDPFEEFMIRSDANHIKSRSRIYWTRAFSLVPNNVPDFLADLKMEILYCGKTMNLLKLCNPDSPLCKYALRANLPTLLCCCSSAQLEAFGDETKRYYADAASECEPRLFLQDHLREPGEEMAQFAELIERKRQVTLKRIQAEKRVEAEKKALQKRRVLEELTEQMKAVSERKRREKEEELALDIALLEAERKRTEAIKTEGRRIIEYYGKLMGVTAPATGDDVANANAVVDEADGDGRGNDGDHVDVDNGADVDDKGDSGDNENANANDNERVLNRMNLRLEIPGIGKAALLASPGQEDVMNEAHKAKLRPQTRTQPQLPTIRQEDETDGTESVRTGTGTADTGDTFASGFEFPTPTTAAAATPLERFGGGGLGGAASATSTTGGRQRQLLQQSVRVALEVQAKLAGAELLRHFVVEERALEHLHSLRRYFFLLDGEFARRLTEGLFRRLHGPGGAATPGDARTLQLILDEALRASGSAHEHADRLSWEVGGADAAEGATDVLGRLSLSYRVGWPLNVLLPSDALDRYRSVFRHLLRLQHASWALRRAFRDLRAAGCRLEPEKAQRLHLYRHLMTHFVQALQNYTLAEVLQSSWAELRRNLMRVRNLDQLYNTHALYVKTVVFRCLLNRKCAPIMRVIEQLLALVVRFCGCLSHRPNLNRLQELFRTFQQYASFIFRFAHKMARVGYQPHLARMLDMLNVNDYYGCISGVSDRSTATLSAIST